MPDRDILLIEPIRLLGSRGKAWAEWFLPLLQDGELHRQRASSPPAITGAHLALPRSCAIRVGVARGSGDAVEQGARMSHLNSKGRTNGVLTLRGIGVSRDLVKDVGDVARLFGTCAPARRTEPARNHLRTRTESGGSRLLDQLLGYFAVNGLPLLHDNLISATTCAHGMTRKAARVDARPSGPSPGSSSPYEPTAAAGSVRRHRLPRARASASTGAPQVLFGFLLCSGPCDILWLVKKE